jgi:hypothetical protein
MVHVLVFGTLSSAATGLSCLAIFESSETDTETDTANFAFAFFDLVSILCMKNALCTSVWQELKICKSAASKPTITILKVVARPSSHADVQACRTEDI